MLVDLSISERATCRRALELYDKALEAAIKAVEKCERSTLDLEGVRGAVRWFDVELKEPVGKAMDRVRTLDVATHQRLALTTALRLLIDETGKRESRAEDIDVETDAFEEKKEGIRRLITRLSDQLFLELTEGNYLMALSKYRRQIVERQRAVWDEKREVVDEAQIEADLEEEEAAAAGTPDPARTVPGAAAPTEQMELVREERHEPNPIDVPCPHCEAPVYAPCTSTTGRPIVEAHMKRIVAANIAPGVDAKAARERYFESVMRELFPLGASLPVRRRAMRERAIDVEAEWVRKAREPQEATVDV